MFVRFAFLVLLAQLVCIHAKAQYYDYTIEASAASFVDTVEQSVGPEKFAKIPRIYAFTLAKTLGQLERNTLTPEAFVEHIEEAEAVRNRFYPEMNSINYRTYLLPIRIRSEYVTSAGWRKSLREKVEPTITGITDPQQAAAKVLLWCKAKVKLTDTDQCYPLGLKGDLDPLTTLDSGSGSETDISILAVAALRSIGVVSRLAYAYTIAGENGGKIWVEYRTAKGWNAWVASGPDGTDGKQYLLDQFGTRFTLILANPEQPINITSTYVPVSYITAVINNAESKNRPSWNLLVLGKRQLYPITGRNIYLSLPDSVQVAAGNYIITAGDRTDFASLDPISIKVGQHGSYALDVKTGTQTFDLADKPPVSTDTPSNNIQEMDPSAVHNPALW